MMRAFFFMILSWFLISCSEDSKSANPDELAGALHDAYLACDVDVGVHATHCSDADAQACVNEVLASMTDCVKQTCDMDHICWFKASQDARVCYETYPEHGCQ